MASSRHEPWPMRPACPGRLVKWNGARRQGWSGEMVGTRRNLAPVLGADGATGRERSRDGGPNLILADVIVNAQSHVMLRNAGNEPARAVGACATGKPPVLGHADVWGATAAGGAAPAAILHVYCLQPVTL